MCMTVYARAFEHLCLILFACLCFQCSCVSEFIYPPYFLFKSTSVYSCLFVFLSSIYVQSLLGVYIMAR